MCVSTPRVSIPETKTEAPTQTVEMNSADSTEAMRESDILRRRRALSRLRTMQGGAMQGSETGTGLVKLGA